MPFNYYSPVTVNAGQVPSSQTDFPMLVSYTDARLKTVANGGHVLNSSGFDIRPYSDPTLIFPLTYELEFYNGTTGTLVMWVKMTSLSSGSTIYLAYGNAALVTDGSSSTTWDANYKGVWHFPNGTTLSRVDSTGITGTLNIQNSVAAAAGKIDGGVIFGGAFAARLTGSDAALPAGAAPFTAEAWVKPYAFSFFEGYINYGNSIASQFIVLGCTPAGQALFSNFAQGVASTTVLTVGTWTKLAVTYDGTIYRLYVNGASEGVPDPGVGNIVHTGTFEVGSWFAGNWQSEHTMDEVRMSSIARSADWIATEYNNQFAPSTFATLGSESSTVVPSPSEQSTGCCDGPNEILRKILLQFIGMATGVPADYYPAANDGPNDIYRKILLTLALF